MAKKTPEIATGAPAMLTTGTIEQQVWIRDNGDIRIKLDVEDKSASVIAQLESIIVYLRTR